MALLSLAKPGATPCPIRFFGRESNLAINSRSPLVSPGAIPTELERKHYEGDRAAFDRRVIERQSLPFRSDIRDDADAMLYLLSPQSRFVTGQELHVNGGWYMG